MDLPTILAIASLAVSLSVLAGIAVGAGERRERLNTLGKEVEKLRERYHNELVPVFTQIQSTLVELSTKIVNLAETLGKLEAKIERHSEAT